MPTAGPARLCPAAQNCGLFRGWRATRVSVDLPLGSFPVTQSRGSHGPGDTRRPRLFPSTTRIASSDGQLPFGSEVLPAERLARLGLCGAATVAGRVVPAR